ncbi:hypothetical protein ONE63_006999 [Megalurothrips usitatus]|uniref:Uncharacterized protein n=1 Tax=Megalurothrips usitatus TaxID=439358 RepID=A0AAV7XXK3_9NEOP|nr:hypothetical protein ONE63_006999 [Megalurothrips usitatus]
MRTFLLVASVAAVLALAQAGPTPFGTFRKDSVKKPTPSVNLLDKLKPKKDSTGLVVDYFVDNVLFNLDSSVPTSINLKDVSHDFRVKFLDIFRVPVSVSAKSGSLSGLGRTYRTSESSLNVDEIGNLYLDAAIGFPQIKFGYDYDIKLTNVGLGPSGHFTATWSNLKARVRLAVDVDPFTCTVSGDSLEVVELGTLQVEATGLGPLNGLYSGLLSSLAEKVGRDELVSAIRVYLGSHTVACGDLLKNWTDILPKY